MLIRLGQRVEYVERGHEIEGVTRKRRRGDSRSRQPRAAQLVADAEPDLGQVEAVRLPEGAQKFPTNRPRRPS